MDSSKAITHLTTSYRYLVDRDKEGLTECAFIFDHSNGEWFFQYENDTQLPIKIDRKGKEFTAYHYLQKKKKIKHCTITYIGKTIDFVLKHNEHLIWGEAFTDNFCPDYVGKEIVEFYTYDFRSLRNQSKPTQPLQTYVAKNDDLISSMILACNTFIKQAQYESPIIVKEVKITKEKKTKEEVVNV